MRRRAVMIEMRGMSMSGPLALEGIFVSPGSPALQAGLGNPPGPWPGRFAAVNGRYWSHAGAPDVHASTAQRGTHERGHYKACKNRDFGRLLGTEIGESRSGERSERSPWAT